MVAALRKRYPAWAKESTPLSAEQVPAAPAKAHPMDSEENQAALRVILEWWLQARESQALTRMEMEIDDNFYHGDQYSAEDRAALEAVGQAPLVFNKVKPVVDWLIGTERRTRVDFNVLPRKKGYEVDAQVKKDVLKYISDVSKVPFARSEAFKEAVTSGLGWLEVGVRLDSEDDPIYVRQESWRNMWYDALGTSKDTSDWRYLFRSKWTDLDIGCAMFPDRAADLKRCATSVGVDLMTNDDDEFYIGQRFSRRDASGNQIGIPNYSDNVTGIVNNRRERIRLVECWYRMPTRGQKVKGGKHHGRVVNLKNQKMMYEVNAEVKAGQATVYDAVVMQVKCAVFCEGVLLQNMDSPYHHNRFPFIPVFAYRKGKFHEPYGTVRNTRDPQEDLNKRYSKALFLLSSTRIIADRNAVKDWDGIREEVGRPDAQLLLDTPKARFEVLQEKELAEEQVRLMGNDGLHIQEISGVTSENLGRDTNAVSGKAVLAKQTQGSVVSAELFDNLRYAQQLLGEITLSVAEQFIDQPKAIRISGEKGAVHWRDINNQDGTNDITATQMDYIVTEQDFRDTMRQAMLASMSDMVSKMPPELGIQLLDAVVDLMDDLPGKADLIARIRKVNGQMPPPEQMSEEQKQQAAAQEQKAQEQAQLKQEAIALEFAEKRAKIAKLNAEVQRIQAEADAAGADGGDTAGLQSKIIDITKRAATMEITLRQQLADAMKKLADRSHEINVRAATEIAKAHMSDERSLEEAAIKQKTDITVAEIDAANDKLLGLHELAQEVDSLNQQLTLAKQQKSLTKPADGKKKAAAKKAAKK